MKALTLTQPWATLIAIGAKTLETRSWPTKYRGTLAIHAAAKPGKGGMRGWYNRCAIQEPFVRVLGAHPSMLMLDRYNPYAMPFGAIVAVCELADVVRSETLAFEGQWSRLREGGIQTWTLTDQEQGFGDYTAGRFAWLLTNIRMLPEPIPAKGQLGLWEWQPPEGFEYGH